ncbi:hypothetical protein GE061_000059 [Apolygus lucorum]|uniref:DDE Tnp4 domain-containing protein n=1 Tax=Apolygus lucorum TaxID=248454 RepID=A0A8S9Y3C0_APOLU|nr:hypothetical protein GE061_000059 [Apolygus lucorum]
MPSKLSPFEENLFQVEEEKHKLVGDQAFPLLPQLMRPFPSSNHQTPMQRIFNYRHCRARRVVENAFGVLSSRFRIFRKPIIASEETVDAVVQAAVVLHDWLRNDDLRAGSNRYTSNVMFNTEFQDGTMREGIWRNDCSVNFFVPASNRISAVSVARLPSLTPAPTGLIPATRTTLRNSSQRAKGIRDMLATYFTTVGQVPWQWQHLPDFQRPRGVPSA